ncbi:MAG: helix-turn-helix transcriptional regulator [Acidimicrobiia bacterium]
MTRRNAGPASDEIENAIQRWRSELGLTQQQLADMTRVTRKTINTIENGHFVPSAVLALRIAAAFGVAVEKVFWLTNTLDPVERPQRQT